MFQIRIRLSKSEHDLALRAALSNNLPVFVMVYILIKTKKTHITKKAFICEYMTFSIRSPLASHTWNQPCIKCSLREPQRRKNKH